MSYVIETIPTTEHVARRETRVLIESDPATGRLCMLCDGTFADGDETFSILLGVGINATQRARALAGQTYNAQWVLVHIACALGT